MARDYKHRFNSNRSKKRKTNTLGLVKSMLISSVIMSIVVLVLMAVNQHLKKPTPVLSETPNNAVIPPPTKNNSQAVMMDSNPPPPQFDFYTVLPERDIVIPDYEIKMRAREESTGQISDKHYIMQAGSFKTETEAEQLRTRLANMGIESTIQKAKIETTIWYRVKLGPYSQMNSISALRSRLRENGIDVIVTELGN